MTELKRLSDDDEAIAEVLEGLTMFKGYKLSDAITPSDRAVARAAEDEILKQVVEWEEGECPHVYNPNYFRPRHLCNMCHLALNQQIEEAK